MTEAFITPSMLRWARLRSREEVHSLASKMKVNIARYEAWESGETHPTMKQAYELARRLRVPIGYLYLSEPPDENTPLPDLRRPSNSPVQKPSPDFLDVLYDALRKQDWYREFLIGEGSEPLPFIGQSNMQSDPEEVADSIREVLRMNDRQRPSTNWGDYLRDLILRTEDVGILVLQSGYVGNANNRPLNLDEFRGFAISDSLAPLIFINNQDYIAAQTFTLAHELAHLWIGESGISNPDYRETPEFQANEIDQFCDKIAAEVLAPSRDFMLRWNTHISYDRNIDALARQYRVSSFVVLRRAFELGLIERDVYTAKYVDLIERVSTTSRSSSGSGNYYNTAMVRNSRRFSRTLIAAVAEGRILPSEAATLVNVRAVNLHNFEDHVLSL